METRALVERIAELARLRFSEEDLSTFAQQFERILHFIGTIETLELEEVEPLVQVIPTTSALREDIPQPSLPREEALRNAPKHNGVFFRVPKVIE
ncbi:MAG: Asp-tRNA(Asn)/Glu-tRNA(Gln) amidotransferase subunit GatC [Candidatus Kapabacteria bacterium]|nr:Asp-tRNA(Asn)/Glu-tRNA(Gln) amidotransferase subunit GatC [Candidatus Kapabacteria bacterium]MCS7170471.1 Asp-tRNA(Asn)/Glu-tRNA(Gln) amidotransferase subunit GatC [Candidatus Kapabacteria bacterium]MDW7996804.1 Asp-tRNA(Asn)/Glu-tRNA(Gln) amidotransferase subunit GatC [Bacteroidota bacterium]MDW8225501.1 Asp-tRNA(Asn)/Glu-tRNA(Gln) amidotransferase subunit GatC [Bacteroidota bacterium]